MLQSIPDFFKTREYKFRFTRQQCVLVQLMQKHLHLLILWRVLKKLEFDLFTEAYFLTSCTHTLVLQDEDQQSAPSSSTDMPHYQEEQPSTHATNIGPREVPVEKRQEESNVNSSKQETAKPYTVTPESIRSYPKAT